METGLTQTQVSELYVAIFGRSSEGEGNAYWQTNQADRVSTAEVMLTTSAAIDYFDGALDNDQDFIEHIYENTLGKTIEDDPEGIAYWVNELAPVAEGGKGKSRGQVIVDLIDAITDPENAGDAQDQFANRVEVSNYVADNIDDFDSYGYDYFINLNDSVDNTEDSVDAATDQVDASVQAGNAIELTADTDIMTGNSFHAGLGYNPGGTDRINYLQDEDILTGEGLNPVLTAELGNSNDNGDDTVGPLLNGIEVVNVAFTGSGDAAVDQLDLQGARGLTDAINITRINDGIQKATIDNINDIPVELSIANSGQEEQDVEFAFDDDAVSGAADSVQLTLNDVDLNELIIQERSEVRAANNGIETINLVSEFSANAVDQFIAEDLQALNISGNADLTLGQEDIIYGPEIEEAIAYAPALENVAGSLETINATGFTGDLDITLGAELNAVKDGTTNDFINMVVTGGEGDDIFRLIDGIDLEAGAAAGDTIDGGAGDNTLVLLGNHNVLGGSDIMNVQNLEIRTGHDADAAADVVTVDADAFDSLASIWVRNEGSNGVDTVFEEDMTVNLNDLTAEQAQAITIVHGTSDNNGVTDNILNVNLKDATGAADLVAVTVEDDVNADPRFNFTLSTPDVENVTIHDNDTESNTIALEDVNDITGTLTITGGDGTNFLNLDTTTAGGNGGLYQYNVDGYGDAPGTAAANGQIFDWSGEADQVRVIAQTIDASTSTADVVVRVSNAALEENGGQNIMMGFGDDTVIFDALDEVDAGLTVRDTVVGGEGTDTLVIDGDLLNDDVIHIGPSETLNVSGFENLRFVNGSSYELVLSNNLIDNNQDANGYLNIINDHDPVNDRPGAPDTYNGVNQVETDIVIDATGLEIGRHFTYNGEEGISQTRDRFIFDEDNDAPTLDGDQIIDGGATDNMPAVHVNYGIWNVDEDFTVDWFEMGTGNWDILEIQNDAQLSLNDLGNIKNVGTILFNGTEATPQQLTVVLNDTIVDNMVDSYHAATVDESERLFILTQDPTSFDDPNDNAAPASLNIDARALTGQSALTVVSDDENITFDETSFANDIVRISARDEGGNHYIDLQDWDIWPDEDFDDETLIAPAGPDDLLWVYDGNSNQNASLIIGWGDDFLNYGGTVTDTLRGIENYNFTQYSGDVFVNSSQNFGNAGYFISEEFIMGVGDDEVWAGAGQDLVNGGGGDDSIYGGGHSDTLIGGDGDDLIFGGASFDVITGDGGNDELYGGQGWDNIRGGDGDDQISGGENSDDLFGDDGDDLICGGLNSDDITGGLGSDTMIGGDGDGNAVDNDYTGNTLWNGIPNGVPVGGTTDVFHITNGDSGLTTATADVISDFFGLQVANPANQQPGNGEDKLDLDVAGVSKFSGQHNFVVMDANTTNTNQINNVELAVQFANNLTGAGNSFDGSIHYIYVYDSQVDGGGVLPYDSYLVVDADLDGAADYAITFTGLGDDRQGVVAEDIV
ncbi:hypothetical protein SAMN02746065_109139 [Desulfocicer vacuolatum DSM 3385]|uniref:DUF4214 domain-containing protein n=1 Tax=Desulfocicer vacuolatum DSM 3385 TaxID=1121400 RepID=A0A1W2BUS2_9BACT|nr:calcium-binding protein [Desulfocicer vacuolatum]SMC76484.1 hypothetical protein SAMN02746065_109139 [Desulfocicer vacuolatum DSM 3385]